MFAVEKFVDIESFSGIEPTKDIIFLQTGTKYVSESRMLQWIISFFLYR